MIPQFDARKPVSACHHRCQISLRNRFNLGKPPCFFRIGKKAGTNGVGGQLAQLFAGECLLGVCEQVLVDAVGAEEGRIVGVECHQQARVEAAPQRMSSERGANAGAHVGGRVQFERDAPRFQLLRSVLGLEWRRVRGRCARNRWRALPRCLRGRWFRRRGWSGAVRRAACAIVQGMERRGAGAALVAAEADADDRRKMRRISAALRKTCSASSTVKWRTASKIQ